MQEVSFFPLPFWLLIVALLGFGWRAWTRRNEGWGLPALAVLGTVAAWYVGDALYNDYSYLESQIGAPQLESAWWETLLFVLVFGGMAVPVHRLANRSLLYRPRQSQLLAKMRGAGICERSFQSQLDGIGKTLAVLWAILMVISLVRTKFDFVGVFMPYLGSKADPWGRGRVGGGFDSLLALAGYLQVFLTAAIGIVAALALRKQTHILATALYFLAVPAYIFDRTRNTMLATVLPALLAWTFFRLRASTLIKIAVLAASFLVVDSWMKFVIQNRSDNAIASVFSTGGIEEVSRSKQARHAGLNMFEELAWINLFMENGSYQPNWGQRYFAEIVNPVPRVLWQGKPMIGIDYAIARGQGLNQSSGDNDAGVGASISTGMIGQGVVNFGRLFGPVAAALIMTLWVALLARQDLLGGNVRRLLLYSVGLVLTFNMGRDITLLVVYPFFFGYLLLLLPNNPKPESRSASVCKVQA